MAESFDPFEINISSSPSDPLKNNAEDDHEVSQLEAGLNGIASGILKVPEGFVYAITPFNFTGIELF